MGTIPGTQPSGGARPHAGAAPSSPAPAGASPGGSPLGDATAASSTSTAPSDASSPPAPRNHDFGPVVVGPSTRFEGLLAFDGRAQIEGSLRGDVICRGTLRVGEQAVIEGTIEVDELVLYGNLRGDVVARDRIELGPTAEVEGSIRAPRILLADGCRIEGRCETSPAAVAGD